MKSRIALAVAVATICLAAVAQAQTNTMTVIVPFNFTAFESEMPSGEYQVRRLNERTLSLQPKSGHGSILLVTDAKELLNSDNVGRLVFNRIGSSYFLAEVWGHGMDIGRVVRKSDTQIQLARNAKQESIVVRAARD